MKLLTDRDNQIIKLIAQFGQTYLPVVDKQLFGSVQYARNRMMNILYKKFGLLELRSTGVISPRSYFVLSEEGKSYAESVLNITKKEFAKESFTITNYERDYYSQIVYLAMVKLGFDVVRNGDKSDLLIRPMNVPIYIDLAVANDQEKYKNGTNERVYAVVDRLAASNLSVGLSHIQDSQISIVIIDEILEGTLTFYTIKQLNKEVNKK